jgi:hypothetical protein
MTSRWHVTAAVLGAALLLPSALITGTAAAAPDVEELAPPISASELPSPPDGITYSIEMVNEAEFEVAVRKTVRMQKRMQKERRSGQLQERASSTVRCKGTVNNPHWSKGGATVVFKDRVVCNGTYRGSVPVGFTGSLSFGKGGSPGNPIFGPLQIKRQCSLQTRNIVVNNPSPSTFYCPPTGSAPVKKSGTYAAWGRIAIGAVSDVGASPNVYVKAG